MLVEVKDLQRYMSDIELTTDQEYAAELVLKGVQAELQRYLNRSLEVKTLTEQLIPDLSGMIYPSYVPITNVTVLSVTYPNTGYVTQFDPLLYPPQGNAIYVGYFTFPVTITYTGGWDASEDSQIILGILRVAAREMTRRHDDTLSVKELTTDNQGEPPQQWQYGWLPAELKAFDRLRRRVVA